ncbi:hypothetical protein IscW_ISCW015141, partial [Ixodes scapularis]
MQTLLGGFLVLVVFTGASDADLIFENWPVGFTCNTSAQCRSLFPGSHCAYNGCLCIKGHYYDWKKIACVPRLLLGEACSNDIECSSLLMCNGNKCVCMPGYKQVKDWCEPLQKRDDLDSFIEFPVDEPNFLTVIIRGLGIIILKASANEIISSRRATDSGLLVSAANRRLLVFPGTEKKSVHVSSKYSSRGLPIRLLSKRIKSEGVVFAL